MDIKQLEALACVIETGSFSRAAEKLNLRQPTISAHVAALERELQVRLIVRTTRELRPTEAGKKLYSYARRILALRDDAVASLRSMSEKVKGTVTVATSTIPGKYLLPPLLREFRKKYPNIVFQIRLTDSRGAVNLVVDQTVDVGLCGTLPGDSRCLYRELSEDQLVVITPNIPRYRRFIRSGFPTRQLAREHFISRESGSGTRRETEQFLREMGVDYTALSVEAQVNSNEQLRSAVAEGKGIGIISLRALEDDCQTGRLLALKFSSTSLHRKLYIIRRRNAPLPLAAQIFYQFAESACPKLPILQVL